jgi:MOSC domain-containing protein YiiM
MKLISVNVGRPRSVPHEGGLVTTSIFKEPVAGRVRVRRTNIDGDEQSDLRVHGGRDKAVYVYPSEHYAFWRGELPGVALPWGAFGENLTIEGLTEDIVAIGDTIRCGSAEFQITTPRLPCFKLAMRLGRNDMVERFMAARRSGFYTAVLREGEIGAGDAIELVPSRDDRVTVREIADLFLPDRADRDVLLRASRLAALPESWQEKMRARL